jgi:hypothetical protein
MNNQDIEYAQYLIGSNNKLVCGIDTAIKALRPTSRYDMSASGGHFEFTRWEDDADTKAPTKDEIMKEMVQTLANLNMVEVLIQVYQG